ncbi:MAG TPA: hypothetical protein VI942_13985 [Thermoanaerobaculia bacterium]|nr:hypothetical protein [Thermoanaerobaculia bacterium]
MKTPALVAVDADPEKFAALFAEAAARGARVGWLDLAGAPASRFESPAAEAGAAKAVAMAPGRVVAVKRVGGVPVLRDLLREHFVGYALVLIANHDGWPRLTVERGTFLLQIAPGRGRTLDAAALLDELARPRHRAR